MPRFGNQFTHASSEKIQRAVIRLLQGAGKVIPLPEALDARIRNVGSGERPISSKPGPRRADERRGDERRGERAGGDDTH
jgi:hypothetical protein